MGTFVAVYIRRSGAAAWLMRVPLGGTWVAVGYGWVAFRVWLIFLSQSVLLKKSIGI